MCVFKFGFWFKKNIKRTFLDNEIFNSKKGIVRINMKLRINVHAFKKWCFFYCIFYTLTRAFLGSVFGSFPYILYLAAMGFCIISYFITYSIQKQKITKNSYYILYAVYMIYIFFNMIILPNSSKYALYEYLFYMLMFFAVCSVFSNFKIETVLYAYEFIGVFVSIEAIWEFITGNLPFRMSEEAQVIRRACGLVGTPLTLGMVLACLTLMAFYLGKIKSSKHYIISILNFTALLMTQSRGPLMGFVIAFLILNYFDSYRRTGKYMNSMFKLILKCLVIFCILMIVIYIFGKNNAFITTILKRAETISEWSGNDNSNMLRQKYWKIGLSYFKQYPIFGYGVSTSGTHSLTHINVESGVIKKLMETGIVGFALYYVMFVSNVIMSLKKCMRNKGEYYPLAIAVIIAIFVENMVLQIIESAATFLLFIIFFTCLVMEGNGKKEKDKEKL